MFELIQNIDNNITLFISSHITNELVLTFFKWITLISNGALIWIFFALLFLKNKKTRLFAVCFLISLLIAYVLNDFVLKQIFKRPRPFIYFDFLNIYIKKPKNFSFPSGHSLTGFLSASFIFCFNKKLGKIAFVLAFLIATSRLVLMVHFFSDVVIGAILGIILGLILFKFYNNLNNNYN